MNEDPIHDDMVFRELMMSAKLELPFAAFTPVLVSAVFQMLFVVLIAIQIEAMILRLRNAKNPTALTS